jgi:hypothetical protein
VQQLGATATWTTLQPSGLRVDVQMPTEGHSQVPVVP